MLAPKYLTSTGCMKIECKFIVKTSEDRYELPLIDPEVAKKISMLDVKIELKLARCLILIESRNFGKNDSLLFLSFLT